jgi:5'-nucleotidase (lipoprotein e(P4) family)
MKKVLMPLMAISLSILANAAFSDNTAIECAPSTSSNKFEHVIKWYRDSAEKKALYRQAYYMGSAYIRQWVAQQHPTAKTWGVVLDIDETTLDNSWYFYQCGNLAHKESDFEHFVTIPQKSQALPGVVALTQLVHRLGGYVSLVSNRDGSYRDASGSSLAATIANLKQQHIVFDQVILANYKTSQYPSDKNPRFNALIYGRYDAKEMVWSKRLPPHQVIAYFGDNIQDFPRFKQAALSDLAIDSQTFDVFGAGYFILPNPMYGSWEANRYH